MARHLLFDVMGTLVYDPFHREVPAFLGMSFDDLLVAKHPTAWLEFERGVVDEPTFLRRFFRDGRAYDAAGLKRVMFESYRWLDGMAALTRELADRGHPLHLVSNYSPWYLEIERRVRLSEVARWTFVSCEAGLRKPDAGVFRRVLADLRAAPEECLLVDDAAVNCAAAIEFGMDAIRFQDAASLRAALEQRVLLDGGPT